jgi:hypothetical protein
VSEVGRPVRSLDHLLPALRRRVEEPARAKKTIHRKLPVLPTIEEVEDAGSDQDETDR